MFADGRGDGADGAERACALSGLSFRYLTSKTMDVAPRADVRGEHSKAEGDQGPLGDSSFTHSSYR